MAYRLTDEQVRKLGPDPRAAYEAGRMVLCACLPCRKARRLSTAMLGFAMAVAFGLAVGALSIRLGW